MVVVILAEKPSQAKDYSLAFQKAIRKDGYFEIRDSNYFNDVAYLTWGIGHLVELVQPEKYNPDWKVWSLQHLPIMPENYKYAVSSSKRKQFNVVKRLLKEKATEIWVATDPDREGENIARSIIDMAGASNKPTKRLWINSLEIDVIQKGFKNLKNGNDYLNLYHEAKARQISDWLVGINASRCYTLLLQAKGMKGAFSAGRVQTPSLYLIYQRQKEVENFKSKPFYEILGEVNQNENPFNVKYNGKFDQLQEAISFLRQHGVVEGENDGIVKSIEKNLKHTKSPKLHSLSTLQTKANKKWKYSPKQVLETVQSLYEKKVVTYPRTSCQYITDSEFNYLVERVDDYKGLFGFTVDTSRLESRKRYVDGSRVGEHYAIVPTKQLANIDELSERELNIYKEVVSTTLAMFAPDYDYEQTKLTIGVNDVDMHATGNVEVNKGWKALFAEDDQKEKDAKDEKLPQLNEGEMLKVFIKTKEGMTKPPKLYTEGELINVMKKCGTDLTDENAKKILKENEGIGTEATRGAIIETLKHQNYIEVKKNTVHVTDKGEILCQAVEGTLLSKPIMTAKWEEYLSGIGKGERTQKGFIRNTEQFIKSLINDSKASIDSIEETIESVRETSQIAACSSCEDGYIEDRGKFYGCTNYSNGCKFTLPKKWAEKTIPVKQIENLIVDGKSDLIKGFKSKKGKKFDAFLIIKDGKIQMEF